MHPRRTPHEDCLLYTSAYRLACAVLNTWERECRESYNCFEHFMLETGRGAGWHQFGGLSAPVAQLFQAYYVPGTITTGHDTFVKRAVWRDDYAALTACLSATRAGRQSVLVALTPGNYAATADVALDVRCRHDGPVSYTHLDVYKRQCSLRTSPRRRNCSLKPATPTARA